MSLESCLQRRDIWRGKKAAPSGDAVATGFAALDQHLPNGGWPQHALTEILVEDIHYEPFLLSVVFLLYTRIDLEDFL